MPCFQIDVFPTKRPNYECKGTTVTIATFLGVDHAHMPVGGPGATVTVARRGPGALALNSKVAEFKLTRTRPMGPCHCQWQTVCQCTELEGPAVQLETLSRARAGRGVPVPWRRESGGSLAGVLVGRGITGGGGPAAACSPHHVTPGPSESASIMIMIVTHHVTPSAGTNHVTLSPGPKTQTASS
eukprot:1438298-Rhodomonas_salina.1